MLLLIILSIQTERRNQRKQQKKRELERRSVFLCPSHFSFSAYFEQSIDEESFVLTRRPILNTTEENKILVMNEYERSTTEEKKTKMRKKVHCSTLTIGMINIDLYLFFFFFFILIGTIVYSKVSMR